MVRLRMARKWYFVNAWVWHSWVWKDVLSFLSGKKTQRKSYSKTLNCTLFSKSTSQGTLRSLKTVWCVRSDKFVHLANLKTESQSRGIVNSWLTFHMKKAHFVMFIREKDIIFDSPLFYFPLLCPALHFWVLFHWMTLECRHQIYHQAITKNKLPTGMFEKAQQNTYCWFSWFTQYRLIIISLKWVKASEQ